jgi:ATP-dependent Clp protease ATP-binding subunit ClpA
MHTSQHLRGLEAHLRSRIIGQDDAIARVSRALLAAEFNLINRGPKPRRSFLYMGPTGVGKTETTKVFTEYLFGHDELAMIFMNQMKSARNLGDFIQQIRRAIDAHPEGTTILCDEVEKAHQDIIDLLISLSDEGEASLPNGDRISIANCYLVMTSNIGALRWASMETTLYSTMEHFALKQAKKLLRPELVGRINEKIIFRPLSQDTQITILGNVLGQKLLHVEPTIGKLSIDTKKVNAHLLRKCFTQAGGARQLKDELDRQIDFALLPWLLSEQRPAESRIYCDPQNDCLVLR